MYTEIHKSETSKCDVVKRNSVYNSTAISWKCTSSATTMFISFYKSYDERINEQVERM